jgi:hypothetical protein
MNNNNNNGDGFFYLLLFVGGAYAIYRIVEAIVAALTILLEGLAVITIAAAAILVAAKLYPHIASLIAGYDPQVHKVKQIETRRKIGRKHLPAHVREHADNYHKELQREVYNPNPASTFEKNIDAAKQIASVYKAGKK